MTDDERTALRDEIDGLTIKQARARIELAEETLRILSELGLANFGGAGVTAHTARAADGLATRVSPSVLTECPGCGRVPDGTAVGFSSCSLGVECIAMTHKQTNKQALVHTLGGPGATAVTGDRAALLAMPAFDSSGEPT